MNGAADRRPVKPSVRIFRRDELSGSSSAIGKGRGSEMRGGDEMQKRGGEEMPYITALDLEIKTKIAAMILGRLSAGSGRKASPSAGKETIASGEGRSERKNRNCPILRSKNSARIFATRADLFQVFCSINVTFCIAEIMSFYCQIIETAVDWWNRQFWALGNNANKLLPWLR
jgi:hypothetical protein